MDNCSPKPWPIPSTRPRYTTPHCVDDVGTTEPEEGRDCDVVAAGISVRPLKLVQSPRDSAGDIMRLCSPVSPANDVCTLSSARSCTNGRCIGSSVCVSYAVDQEGRVVCCEITRDATGEDIHVIGEELEDEVYEADECDMAQDEKHERGKGLYGMCRTKGVAFVESHAGDTEQRHGCKLRRDTPTTLAVHGSSFWFRRRRPGRPVSSMVPRVLRSVRCMRSRLRRTNDLDPRRTSESDSTRVVAET